MRDVLHSMRMANCDLLVIYSAEDISGGVLEAVQFAEALNEDGFDLYVLRYGLITKMSMLLSTGSPVASDAQVEGYYNEPRCLDWTCYEVLRNGVPTKRCFSGLEYTEQIDIITHLTPNELGSLCLKLAEAIERLGEDYALENRSAYREEIEFQEVKEIFRLNGADDESQRIMMDLLYKGYKDKSDRIFDNLKGSK